ncbi:hypothetical protein Psta_3980 [Pirellula staleyi DSM 6068]|uniref:Uncharacterized protein n=1 Tax=Pirellula staleyi (strain ATCC 27377 / DSM 6068 / ICPB 4128) TaxID=530564 RepID=D2R223_PIRSD|nr:hypothetical protein Psta_3980 [Pirellula staleyi DSM 6068]
MYLILLVVEWFVSWFSFGGHLPPHGNATQNGQRALIAIGRDGRGQMVASRSPWENWWAAWMAWWKEWLAPSASSRAPLPPPDDLRRRPPARGGGT